MTEDPTHDSWLVRYDLGKPTERLRFSANRNRYRHAHWRAADGGQWTEHDGFEELQAPSPTTHFEVAFETMSDPLEKDYELNLEFSDGSRLLYTGHLVARPVNGSDATLRWQFWTERSRDIRIREAHGTGELEWTSHGDDSYVYFGGIEAFEGPDFTAIIDPGMPAWLVDATRRLVPPMLEFYAMDTGVELVFEPLLLLSWGGSGRGGRSSGGGSLKGLLQLSAAGDGFVDESPEARLHWQHFLAHEAFHLWNGETFRRRLDHDEEWLSEGSAEYFAERVLLAIGAIDETTMHRRVVTAANLCLTSLDGEPLLGHDPPRFRDYYPCGWALLAHADRAASESGADIGSIMSYVFDAAAARADRTYSTYTFLEGLEVAAKNKRAPAPIERLLRAGTGPRGETFFADLVGDVTLVGAGAATLEAYDFMTRLAGQLVQCDCETQTRPQISAGKITIAPDRSCHAFANGGVVAEVAGHSVTRAPAAAYEALLERSGRRRPIPLVLGDAKRLTMRCREEGLPRTFHQLLRAEPGG